MADEIQNEPKKSSVVRSFGQVEQMVQLAIALPAGCLIGWLAGAWIDKHYGTSWCGVAGIGVGAVAGFVQLFTTAARILNKGK